ncbi:MAG: hypothetical protein ABIH03_03045 [Pseudomonadota bacterium]
MNRVLSAISRDIPKALRQNAVERGIPGTWQLDGVAPNTALQSLPMFYDVDADAVQLALAELRAAKVEF